MAQKFKVLIRWEFLPDQLSFNFDKNTQYQKSIKRILQITSKSHDGTNWTNWIEDFSLLYSAWHSWLNWRLDSSTTEKFFYLACAPKKEAAARAQVKRLKLSQILCPIEIVFEKFQSLQKWSSHLGATFLNRTLITPIWQKVWTSIFFWFFVDKIHSRSKITLLATLAHSIIFNDIFCYF